MFTPFFKINRIHIPLCLVLYETRHPNVKEIGIYVFGIRIAAFNIWVN